MCTFSYAEQGIPVPLTHILLVYEYDDHRVYEYDLFTRSCDQKQPITVPHVILTVDDREKYLKGNH